MKSGSRGNALLVELLFVVMFFMLTTTVLLEVFAKASNFSSRSELLTVSLVRAQNTADQLYSAEDPEAYLSAQGFEKTDEGWSLAENNYVLHITITPETDETGVYRRQEVRVTTGDEELYTLPCSRWEVKP